MEIDSMLEALRLTTSGIIDEVQGIKTTQSGLLERIVTVEARLQNALVGVNKNFVSMSNDIEVQCNVINKLVGTMNQWEPLGADPYLSSRHIESFLRVFKHFACIIPRG